MDQALLEILCCPVTRQPLRMATTEELARFGDDLREGLIRSDDLIVYPVVNGIPCLLPEAGRSVGAPAA